MARLSDVPSASNLDAPLETEPLDYIDDNYIVCRR